MSFARVLLMYMRLVISAIYLRASESLFSSEKEGRESRKIHARQRKTSFREVGGECSVRQSEGQGQSRDV